MGEVEIEMIGLGTNPLRFSKEERVPNWIEEISNN